MKKLFSSSVRFSVLALAGLLVGLATVACAEEAKPTIKFSDQQFESQWINNAIAKFIIENGYGNTVETIETTTPIMQASLTKGDMHVNMEMWEQNIIEWHDESIAAGTLENLGATYEGGPQFFMVPTAFADEHGIKTIDDMKKPAVKKALADPEDKSKGLFMNCVIGWQCAEINRAKLVTYGLVPDHYNIISPGSSGAMEAALAGPQKKGQGVFGYYWAPTAIMGMYDWTVIEEPAYNKACWDEVGKSRDDKTYIAKEACAYETLPINKGVWSGLKDLDSDVYTLLTKMNVGLQPINKTAAWAVENEIAGEWEKAAVYYLTNFEDRWTTWMPEANAKKVKDALAAK